MPRARAERQELSHNIIGLTANVDDLETKIYQHKAVVDDRLYDMNTNMGAMEADLIGNMTNCENNCENQLKENQLQMYNAQKRVYNIMLFCIFAITWLMMSFHWLCYEEAKAEQVRAEHLTEQVRASTLRVENFKTKWLVKAWFLRDWVMTVAWAEYYQFKAWFS